MSIKLETLVVCAKLFCVLAGTSLLTLQTGLGQWSNAEKPPTVIQWVMIVGGSVGTGLTAAGAFLSDSFGSYIKGRNGNGLPPPPPLPQLQQPPKVLLTEEKKPDTVQPT